MEQWRANELGFNAWLDRRRKDLGIVSVGQIESWIHLENGEYHFFELKTQEPFEPPPFLGHGLPRWQVEKYLTMQAACGVIWNLVVFDAKSFVGYRQRLSVLEDGPRHDTFGHQPRRIYSLGSFAIWTQDWRNVVKLSEQRPKISEGG